MLAGSPTVRARMISINSSYISNTALTSALNKKYFLNSKMRNNWSSIIPCLSKLQLNLAWWFGCITNRNQVPILILAHVRVTSVADNRCFILRTWIRDINAEVWVRYILELHTMVVVENQGELRLIRSRSSMNTLGSGLPVPSHQEVPLLPSTVTVHRHSLLQDHR